MSCKSTLYDLFFGDGGNTGSDILKNSKKFVGQATSNWLAIARAIAKDFSQKAIDFIRPIAKWIPGQKFGDDIGGVLTDEELPAFRQLMNRIAKHFAEDGTYTRYIDPQEMALYFRETPEFFKQGYVNALMDTTEHLTDGIRVGDHIVPLDTAGAAARRARWHTFIDELKQGLIDTFGPIRGKQLFDELGLQAAKDAKEINAIIFKWGKMMWNDIFVKAKAAGATDEQATALAKIAAQSHINIVGGVNSGAYSTVANTKSGILGWVKRHPLGAVVGSTAFGMAVWYFLDNYTFHIWMGRAAGVLDKLFGDQADEATYRLKSASFQLKAHPCEPTVQQTYITLLTELKRLVEYCNTHDVIPTDKIPQYKELYKSVYGISIGNPNEMERAYITLDYQFYIDEYVLTVRGAGCTDPIEPPDGWPPYEGTGTIRCTSNQTGFAVYVDGNYIDHSYGNTYLVIQNVTVGSHTVKIEKGTNYTPTHCEKTVAVTEGVITDVDCQMTKIGVCSQVTDVKIYIDPLSPIEDQTVSFNGSAKSDDPITSWEWKFGDGFTATGQAVTHPYGSAGIYTVELKVTNDCENSEFTTRNVTVSREEPPTESTTLAIETPIGVDGKEIDRYWDIEIWVDGKDTRCKKLPRTLTFGTNVFCDCTSPWNLVPCELGQHTITLKADGYDDKSISVYLRKDEPKTWYSPVMVKSVALPPERTIDIVVPVGSTLYVDGKSITGTTTVGRLSTIFSDLRKR